MKNLIVTIAMAAISSGVTFAQETAKTPSPATKPAVIQKRKQVQQKRIADGVANGSLTAKETAKLEAREANLNRKIAAERAANNQPHRTTSFR